MIADNKNNKVLFDYYNSIYEENKYVLNEYNKNNSNINYFDIDYRN